MYPILNSLEKGQYNKEMRQLPLLISCKFVSLFVFSISYTFLKVSVLNPCHITRMHLTIFTDPFERNHRWRPLAR